MIDGMGARKRIEGGLRLRCSSPAQPPLVSIITVVFRAASEIEPLIQSVLRLKDQRTELIVIDGASDDGTCDVLRRYDTEIDYWISEKDEGIYDAMNKGIAAATGQFIFHLNAGDRLLALPMPDLEEAGLENADAVAFRVITETGREFRPGRGLLRVTNTWHHQGTFYKREGFPNYNQSFRIFGDFDANQRLAIRGARIKICDEVVALHGTGGISDQATSDAAKEFFRVIRANYGAAYVVPAWFLCKWRGLVQRFQRSLNR